MASLGLLLLGATLLHTVQCLPAALAGGRGLDMSVGGVRRQRRDVRLPLAYEEELMSYPAGRGAGGAGDLYYQSDDWEGRGLEQALQQLVERDKRREQQEEEEEQQRAAYLAALLRLLSEAEGAGMVGPAEVQVVEEEEEEDDDDEDMPTDFQGPAAPPDYDETGQGLSMGRPPAAWWSLLEPRLAEALLERMEPQLVQSLLERARQQRPLQAGRVPPGPSRGVGGGGGRGGGKGSEQEVLRRLVSRLLSGIPPAAPQPAATARRMRRDLSAAPAGPAHRRARRSLDDAAPPPPSADPPLLRVKRLEVEDPAEDGRPRPPAGLQRMKRVNEELNGAGRRRRRAALAFDPQLLVEQVVGFLRQQ